MRGPSPMSGAGGVAEHRVRHPVVVGPLADDATVVAAGGAEDAVVRETGEQRRDRPRGVVQVVDRPHHRGHREEVAVIGRRHDQRAVEVDGLDRGADRPIELPGLDERPERVGGPVRVVDAPRLDHEKVRPAGRREDLDGLDRHVDDARLAARAVLAVELVLQVARRRRARPRGRLPPAHRIRPGSRRRRSPAPAARPADPGRPSAGRRRPPRRSPSPVRSGAARRRRRRRARRRAGRCSPLRRARAAPRRRSRGPGRSRGRRPPPAWRG